jgi:DNA-binding CsgD family transcriptional regulator
MELIETYLPAGWDGDPRGPEPGATPLLVESERGRLRITAVDPDGDLEGRLLLLEEEPAVSIEALRDLGLTRRQAEVLRLLSAGLAAEEVAAALYISPHTVRKHVEHIYGRLGVNSRQQAVEVARGVSRRTARRGSSRPRS